MSDNPASVGPASEPFAKLPRSEDADGNGLTDRPSVRWLLWCSDALTVFCNGFIDGLAVGAVVGGASAASSDTLNAQTLSVTAALGLCVAAAANGLKAVILWHHTHPMPNPFRAAA